MSERTHTLRRTIIFFVLTGICFCDFPMNIFVIIGFLKLFLKKLIGMCFGDFSMEKKDANVEQNF